MRHARLAGLLVATAALLAAPSVPVGAQAYDDEAYGDDYSSGDYARIRWADDGARVVRADGDDEDSVSRNSPIYPGDLLRTDRDQRVEVELAGGTLVRIDRDSDVTFQSLPDPYDDRGESVLAIEVGTIEVAARLGDDEELRVDTPASSVYVVGDGTFRIDVDDDGRTFVHSRRGVAEVVGDDGSVLVRAGMATQVDPGDEPDDPRAWRGRSDSFDLWASNLEGYDDDWDRYDPDVDEDDLPYTVQPYYRELSSYGHWVSVPTYGWVWYPASVGAGWRPYYDGYWSNGPGGYFWVSSEPWGWAPYHYGRWVHVPRYGWSWVPGRLFAGAWVSWSWGSSYIGWCPLDYWNRPVYVRSVVYDYYDPYCWNFISYDRIIVRDYRRYYVPVTRIGSELRRHAVVTRPPRNVSLRALATSREARERALVRVREDRGARIPAVKRGATPTRRFVDAETSLLRGGVTKRAAAVRRPTAGAGSRAPSVRTPAARPGVSDRGRPQVGARPRPQDRIERGTPSARPRPGARPAPSVRERTREGVAPRRPSARIERPDADRAPARVQPRPRVERDEADRAPARVQPRPRPSDRDERIRPSVREQRDDGARPAVRPRPRPQERSGDSLDRRREMYREMSRPRAPERQIDRRESDRPRPSVRPSDRPQQPRPEARPQAPRPQPRPQQVRPQQPRPQPRPEGAKPRPQENRGGGRSQGERRGGEDKGERGGDRGGRRR